MGKLAVAVAGGVEKASWVGAPTLMAKVPEVAGV
jgi:hypothetical protein